jgi:pyruvate formate lyase activating enzyme
MITLYKNAGERIQCLLCPHFCKIAAGKTGICGVRKNNGKKIELTTYGVISGYSTDPIEKKPLYHFFPGNNIFSVGSYGCNMRCDFCQNFNISQIIPKSLISDSTPEKIVKNALSIEKNIGIAFTYNEPVISFEFMRDTAILAKEAGLFTVMVSNGFVTSEPLGEIIQFIDAFNIDLKAFNNNFYKKLTGADLEPVKDSLIQISNAGKHLEVTTLIIPGQNDNEHEMELQSEWMAGELGKETPFHLSKYFPRFKRDDPSTSEETLNSLSNIASGHLVNVYMGNTISDAGQNTNCPECGTTVTIRSGYDIRILNLNYDGTCNNCGFLIYRYFNPSSLIKN